MVLIPVQDVWEKFMKQRNSVYRGKCFIRNALIVFNAAKSLAWQTFTMVLIPRYIAELATFINSLLVEGIAT